MASIFPFFVIVVGKRRHVVLLDSSLERTSCIALLVYLADALICIDPAPSNEASSWFCTSQSCGLIVADSLSRHGNTSQP